MVDQDQNRRLVSNLMLDKMIHASEAVADGRSITTDLAKDIVQQMPLAFHELLAHRQLAGVVVGPAPERTPLDPVVRRHLAKHRAVVIDLGKARLRVKRRIFGTTDSPMPDGAA